MNSTATSGILHKIATEGLRQVIDSLSDQQSITITERYSTHNYHPLPVNIVRAQGIYAWDGTGKEYIDCIGSYSAVAHGHLSEAVIKAVTDQLEILTLTSRAVYTSEMAILSQALCEYTELDMACPMNTGAEAVETAIKLARKWAYTVKGIEENQAEIITAKDNFHGRTTTIIGFSTEENYKANFGPFTPGFLSVPFGDFSAIENEISKNTAAILMEPIQAEGGILFPPEGFMSQLRKLCDQHQILLIWDEIQTGFCRTGKKFAWMHEDAKPDLICLGKALGGGIYPVSAVVGRKQVMEVFQPGDHGSTFGGNPLAAVVAIAAMAELDQENLAERSEKLGKKLLNGLRNLKHNCIKEVRGRGLLIGLEVKNGTDTEKLATSFLNEGILTKETRHRTFRFAPPLVIEDDLIDEIVRRTSNALDAVS